MRTLPHPVELIRGATLMDGAGCDVEITGDTVTAVRPAGESRSGERGARVDPDRVLELEGFVLLTAPAEPHAHLDKALSWDLIDPPMGDLEGAIESWRRYSAEMTVDGIAERARTQALAMLANGTTAVRTHVDVLTGPQPLRGAQALVRVREELAGLMDIELVALAAPDCADEALEAMLDLGVDLVGGAPHLAPDPQADLHRLLAVARRRGVGVDLHTDESLAGEVTLLDYAAAVRSWPSSQQRSAGHCVRLGTLEQSALLDVLDAVVAADVGVITLPITNLYLQGRAHPVATPRGLTAVRALLEHGARLGAGADNVRDPFNPVGRSDALETASLLVVAAHLTLTEAYDCVSRGARDVMGLPVAGVATGARADLLAVRGRSLGDVVANAPADRYVVHAGQLVAHSEERRTIAAPRAVARLGGHDEVTPR